MMNASQRILPKAARDYSERCPGWLTGVSVICAPLLLLMACGPRLGSSHATVKRTGAFLAQDQRPADAGKTNGTLASNQQGGAPPGMVRIPAGIFRMGEPPYPGEPDCHPVYAVFVSQFYMDRYEVTKALWDEVYHLAGGGDSDWPPDDYGTWEYANDLGYYDSGQEPPPDIPLEVCSVGDVQREPAVDFDYDGYARSARAHYTLKTGGKAMRRRSNLFSFYCSLHTRSWGRATVEDSCGCKTYETDLRIWGTRTRWTSPWSCRERVVGVFFRVRINCSRFASPAFTACG